MEFDVQYNTWEEPLGLKADVGVIVREARVPSPTDCDLGSTENEASEIGVTGALGV